MRLQHGYTNWTTRSANAVEKRCAGPDAEERRTREHAALVRLQGRLPVPPVLGFDGETLTMAYVDGRHGQELLDEGHAGEVLATCGHLLRELQSVPHEAIAELGTPEPGQVLVHGDFGPQNLLFDPRRFEPVALLDWELVRWGHSVHDLAWTEWIIRTHHPEHIGHLLDRPSLSATLAPGLARRARAAASCCASASRSSM